MKIVFLDSHTLSLNGDIDFSPIESLGDYNSLALTNEDNILDYLADTRVIITNKIIISRDHLKKLNNLKLITVIATGYDNIDIQASKDYKIPITNVPQYARYSVSQHTFALILNLASKLYLYNSDVANGQWEESDSFTLLKHPTFELAGKVIGLIGFGAIGREVSKIAEGFNMKVMVYDIADVSRYGHRNSTLDEVLEKSDIISIHLPLTDKTKDLIDKSAFNKMKETALIANTSRGGIVNEVDCVDALNSGKIAGAGFDVLSSEPPTKNNPLLGEVKNLILTPHVAWSSKEARQRLIDITGKNIESMNKGNIINRVN